MKKALSIFLFLLTAAAFGVTASTPIFGVFKGEIPANSEAYIGITATRAPVFTGVVGSVDTSLAKVTAKGEKALWTANQFKFADGTQPEHYYLKITSGELEGAWYDIITNDDFSVTIEIGDAEIAKLAAEKDTTFQIIPHWTMATLFPNGGGFSMATKLAATTGATVINKYTEFGGEDFYSIGINRAPKQKFIYRKRGTTDNWRLDSEDASNYVIEPNSVLKALEPSGAGCTYSYTGVIPMCATSLVLFTLSDENGVVQPQDIFIPVPASVDFKVSELTSALIDSGAFVPSTKLSASAVDSLYVYDKSRIGDGQNLAPSNTLFYRKRGTTNEWKDKNGATAQDFILTAGTCLKVNKKATDTEVSVRCKFTPNYISK